MKGFVYSILFLLGFAANAQVVKVQLISKMDVKKHFELWDGKEMMLMGYSSDFSSPLSLPSPTLIFEEGDSIELSLLNMSQRDRHTIHLHGLDVNQENDGVPMLSFDVPHDSTGVYRFRAPHPGTYLYHCHVKSTIHVQAGMYGMIIVKPKDEPNKTWKDGYEYDEEIAWLMSEIDTFWHHDSIINKSYEENEPVQLLKYNPQYFLINGQSEQQLDSVKTDITGHYYLRLSNLGFTGNVVYIPSNLNPTVVSSDGRPLPKTFDGTEIEVYPGERYGVLIHCDEVLDTVISIQYKDLNTHQSLNEQQVIFSFKQRWGKAEFIEDNTSIQVYPNPTSSLLTIHNTTEESLTFDLVNMEGKKFRTLIIGSNEKLIHDISDIPNGIYLLSNTRGNHHYSKEIIIKQ